MTFFRKLQNFMTLGAISFALNCTSLPAYESPGRLHTMPVDFTAVAKTAVPAVVSITVKEEAKAKFGQREVFGSSESQLERHWLERFFDFNFDDQLSRQPSKWQGSGFIVSADGYIITNSHVVAKSSEILVSLNDGREFPAKVIGQDSHTDLAIIKIDASGLPFLKLGDSDQLEVGQWVAAIGTPLGLQASLTVGVVSAKGRNNLDLTRIEDFIQTDAVLNKGNSGGPLLNLNNEVVGVNTAIASSMGGYMGIGFAIPSKIVATTMEQLIASGSVARGFIGVGLQQMNPDLAAAFRLERSQGLVIAEVVKGSPAEKGGLKVGDVIVKYNGTPITNIGSFRTAIALMLPGSEVKILVIREGEPKELSIVVGDEGQSAGAKGSANLHQEALGVTVDNLSPQLAKSLQLKDEHGVVVTKVSPGSIAQWAGLRTGTLIMEVNKQKIESVEDFQAAISALDRSRPILLLVKEKGHVKFISIKVD